MCIINKLLLLLLNAFEGEWIDENFNLINYNEINENIADASCCYYFLWKIYTPIIIREKKNDIFLI